MMGTAAAQAEAPTDCRWPAHRDTGLDWRGEHGRIVCGVCHPQPAVLAEELDKGAIIGADPENAPSNGAGPAAARPAKGGGGAPQFVARRLAEQLAAETRVATSTGGQLYVFRRGAYRPGGERDLRGRIAAALGDHWKEARARETLGYLRDTTPQLWPEPPRDQINVANGILDIPSGKLSPHDPEFLSPVQIPVAYDPAATCPAIDGFLGEVLAPELAGLVYELAGYLVTPDQSLQIAVMLLGEGANGKSTLLGLLTALVGAGNVSSVALHRLDEDRFATAELEGKLANIFADLDARALQASSMFKSITGGDAISAERKFLPAFSFKPYARLLYSANEPPPTPDSSDAFFRRWLILEFERRFDANRADRRLLEKLTAPAELSGLLRRGLEALPSLRERGAFSTTEATALAAERFRVDADSVAGFLGDACELDPEARTPRPRLFAAYREWCQDSNRKPLGKQRFNRRIPHLRPTLTTAKIRGEVHWAGIRVVGSGL